MSYRIVYCIWLWLSVLLQSPTQCMGRYYARAVFSNVITVCLSQSNRCCVSEWLTFYSEWQLSEIELRLCLNEIYVYVRVYWFFFEYGNLLVKITILIITGIHWQHKFATRNLTIYRITKQNINSMEKNKCTFLQIILDFIECYQCMLFKNIHSIADLPFMYNQNTNSLIIAQKYLTNSFLWHPYKYTTDSLYENKISKRSHQSEP